MTNWSKSTRIETEYRLVIGNSIGYSLTKTKYVKAPQYTAPNTKNRKFRFQSTASNELDSILVWANKSAISVLNPLNNDPAITGYDRKTRSIRWNTSFAWFAIVDLMEYKLHFLWKGYSDTPRHVSMCKAREHVRRFEMRYIPDIVDDNVDSKVFQH